MKLQVAVAIDTLNYREYRVKQNEPDGALMKPRYFFFSITLLSSLLNYAYSSAGELSQVIGTATTETSVHSELFPSIDPRHPPTDGNSPRFELSQSYPLEFTVEEYPWNEIDFAAQPAEYMNRVLQYALEGNIAADFDVQNNSIRKWYHAPWLHDDSSACGNGREHMRGMTRERGAPPFEIHRSQSRPLENWAVGFYNAPGGYTLGRVWPDYGSPPNPEEASFPEGTVSAKLLFTDGNTEEVPFLEGTIEWRASVYPEKPYIRNNGRKVCVTEQRQLSTLRLLQVDIAVRDDRAEKTG